jgi:AraC family transcriptional regulator
VPSPNGVHFHPPAGLLVPGRTEGSEMMDPTDRMLEHDLWLTRRLLDRIATLPEAELDRDVRGREPMAYESDDPTIRAMLDRLVFTREVWIAAVAGRPSPRLDADRSLAGLRARLEASADEFRALVRRARERGEWDTAFVNALRTPPETATFGGMVAHVLTFQACRRGELLEVLRRYGIEDLGYGDPVEWERAVLDRDA